jgi:hypothetical protein
VTAQDDWQRWCDRFDRLHNGILRLFHDRGIWRTVFAMLDANPQVARGGLGEYWLGSCYTDSMLIGIRRETGADNESIGIRRSLNSLAGMSRRSGTATRDETPGNWQGSTPHSTSSPRPASGSSTPLASGRTSPR